MRWKPIVLLAMTALACTAPSHPARSPTTAPPAAAPPPAPEGQLEGCGSAPATTVFLVGDSTVASKTGWGDFLTRHLRSDVVVVNAAKKSRSSKSFYEEKRFAPVVKKLQKGDYVLIQFGHNDGKDDVQRHTEPGQPPRFEGTYRQYIERYVNDTLARGATPILVTSVSRTRWSRGELRRSHGSYPQAIRRIGEDRGLVVLDLEERSYQVFSGLGEAETRRRFNAKGDPTHFPPKKAPRVTQMVADLLRESPSPLRCYVVE